MNISLETLLSAKSLLIEVDEKNTDPVWMIIDGEEICFKPKPKPKWVDELRKSGIGVDYLAWGIDML